MDRRKIRILSLVGLAVVLVVLTVPSEKEELLVTDSQAPSGAQPNAGNEVSQGPAEFRGETPSSAQAKPTSGEGSLHSRHSSHEGQIAFWWDDPVQYEAYAQLFYKRASGQELGILDPKAKLERLRVLDETMANGKHDFLTGVNWAELGEFEDGRDVAFVLRAVREMEEYDLDKLRLSSEMIHSFVYDTPLLVSPNYVVGHVLGKKIQPSGKQSREIERLYWAHLGDRARLDRLALYWSNIDLSARGELGVESTRIEDSFVRPAELAKIQDQVREINRRYIDSLTAYAIAEGLVD